MCDRATAASDRVEKAKEILTAFKVLPEDQKDAQREQVAWEICVLISHDRRAIPLKELADVIGAGRRTFITNMSASIKRIEAELGGEAIDLERFPTRESASKAKRDRTSEEDFQRAMDLLDTFDSLPDNEKEAMRLETGWKVLVLAEGHLQVAEVAQRLGRPVTYLNRARRVMKEIKAVEGRVDLQKYPKQPWRAKAAPRRSEPTSIKIGNQGCPSRVSSPRERLSLHRPCSSLAIRSAPPRRYDSHIRRWLWAVREERMAEIKHQLDEAGRQLSEAIRDRLRAERLARARARARPEWLGEEGDD